VNTPPPKGGGFNYGSKPDWSAFGGHGPSLGDVEVVARCRGRLVLDVVNPHLVGTPRSHPPKGVGFPDPLSGTLKVRRAIDGQEDVEAYGEERGYRAWATLPSSSSCWPAVRLVSRTGDEHV
jgi:hypothetical protein